MKCERVLALPNTAILVVSPHPDDEALGAGGLMRAAALAGRDVTLVSVTDGEAAFPDWRGLGRVRCNELSHALSRLTQGRAAHVRLGIPDGQVNRHRTALFEAIDQRLSSAALLVAPYEHDGHPDHDTAGEVCCEIARLRGRALWRYPIWTWHHGTPRQFASRAWGRFLLDATAIQAKAWAISCFTSQLCPLGREPIVPPHVLPYFTRPYEAFLL